MTAILDPKRRLVTAFALCLQTRVPVLLVGRPGEAKTSTAKAIARKLNWPIHVLPIPGKRDPAQVVGLPQRVDSAVHWLPYKWILDLKDKPNSIIFLDDLAEAGRDMQSFYLALVYERQFGDITLEHASMAAAANPDDGHLDLTPALANRLVHLKWMVAPEEFAAELEAGFPDPEVPVLDPSWTEHLPIWRSAIAQFLRTIPDLRQPDPTVTEQLREEAGPFPSQRTWDFGATLLAASGSLGLDDVERKHLQVLLLRGAIGNAAANSFFTWFESQGLPSPEELLQHPDRLTQGTFAKRPDALWIGVLSVLRHTLFRLDQPDVWDAAWRFLDRLAEDGFLPFGVNAAMILNKRRPAERNGADIPSSGHYARMLGRGRR